MKLNLVITNTVDENFEFNCRIFQLFLFSNRLNNTIQIHENLYEDSVCFEVQRLESEINLICNTFSVKKSFPIDFPALSLCNAILECCGFVKSIIKGMAVKDLNGNKIRPEIEFYCYKTMTFTVPETLIFTKERNELSGNFSKVEIFFDNEILISVLMETFIICKDNERKFQIYCKSGKCFLIFLEKEPALCVDFLTDFTVGKELLKHSIITKNHPVFENFFNGRPENLVFSKNICRTLFAQPQDRKDLIEFVENTPRFQDARDDAVAELKNLIFDRFPKETVFKYDYLEVFKYKQTKNKNRFSLEKFINP